MLPGNRELLAARWPAVLALLEESPEPPGLEARGATLLVEGRQLTGARDRVAEAALQAGRVPDDAIEAAVYGLALGDLPRALLARPGLARLAVVLLAPGAARAALAREDLSDWLADPRVELVDGAGEAGLRRPYAAAPGALRLADGPRARLRDLVHQDLAAPHSARAIAAREAALRARLDDNRARVAADGDAARWFGSRAGGEVLVAAAGPTLEDSLGALAARPRDATLVAVDAALAPLLAGGVAPDVVVTIEWNRDALLPLFDGDLAPCRDAALVYLPDVHGDVLDRWPGPRDAFYGAHPRYAGLRAAAPRATLVTAGSVLHPAVDLAARTGAARVVLVGADLAFPRGRTHARGATYCREAAPHPSGAWVESGRGERLATLPNLRGYLRDLESLLALHDDVEFRTASDEGARVAGAPPVEGWRG